VQQTNMILLWGIAADRPLELVRSALANTNVPVVFLDQQSVLKARIAISMDEGLHGSLRCPEWAVALESITAVYLRPYDVRRMAVLADEKQDSTAFQHALRFEDALTCWTEMTPALVVNRPSAMSSNNSKPFQLQLIRNAGFDVPDTLVTTDPQAVVEFWELHGSVIYKSVSGVRSIVRRLGGEHRDRMQDVAHCPTLFQQYIEGTDFRVHVVGEEIFSCEIESTADDYRYPRSDESPKVRSCEVPQAVADRCRRVAAALDLHVAGIDLRRTPADRWYCFEVNPSPGFSFYEEETGQPIAKRVARLLAQGTARQSYLTSE
jgi:glutathione synthase/RimK-type ligase-like ATP-grasp enzyme